MISQTPLCRTEHLLFFLKHILPHLPTLVPGNSLVVQVLEFSFTPDFSLSLKPPAPIPQLIFLALPSKHPETGCFSLALVGGPLALPWNSALASYLGSRIPPICPQDNGQRAPLKIKTNQISSFALKCGWLLMSSKDEAKALTWPIRPCVIHSPLLSDSPPTLPLFLGHAKHTSTSGPLYWLFLFFGNLLPWISM